MRPILVSERSQFHAHECVEAQHTKRFPRFRLNHVRRRQGIIWAHSFTGELHVHGVAGFRVGTVKEQIDACDVSVDKARRF